MTFKQLKSEEHDYNMQIHSNSRIQWYGALIIRVGFWGPSYYNYNNKEFPKYW